MEARGAHGLHRNRSNPLVIHDLRTPRCFALFLFPAVQFPETPVVVVSQTAEVAENHISKSARERTSVLVKITRKPRTIRTGQLGAGSGCSAN